LELKEKDIMSGKVSGINKAPSPDQLLDCLPKKLSPEKEVTMNSLVLLVEEDIVPATAAIKYETTGQIDRDVKLRLELFAKTGTNSITELEILRVLNKAEALKKDCERRVSIWGLLNVGGIEMSDEDALYLSNVLEGHRERMESKAAAICDSLISIAEGAKVPWYKRIFRRKP
jgi:hypothetical protein